MENKFQLIKIVAKDTLCRGAAAEIDTVYLDGGISFISFSVPPQPYLHLQFLPFSLLFISHSWNSLKDTKDVVKAFILWMANVYVSMREWVQCVV